MSGNYLIDQDNGDHPFSPYFKNRLTPDEGYNCTFCNYNGHIQYIKTINVCVCDYCIMYFGVEAPQEVLESFYFAAKIDPAKNSAACSALIGELLDKKILCLPVPSTVRLINAWCHFDVKQLNNIRMAKNLRFLKD